MLNRKKAGLIVLGLTVASVFVLASQASAADYKNACRNSVVGTNWDQVDVSLNGTASPAAPGGTVTLSNINQTLAVPPGIFVAGYNLGLLTTGVNNIPTDFTTVIDAANTTKLSQTTNTVSQTLSTTITDPDTTPGSGDETATPGTANAHFADETWTAGASGTISFHERNDTGITGATGGGIIAVAHLGGGVLNVQFHCTSGTVAGSSPGVPTFSDAPSFASSQITNPQCKKLQKQLKKAKKAKNKKKVKKIRKKLRKNGC